MSEQTEPVQTILVVDDEENILVSCDTILRMEGYETILCDDGARAKVLLEQHDIDTVLLDVNLPGLTGNELLGHITQSHPQCPVIMITGDNSIELAVTCMKLGAFDYMLKPVDKNRLLHMVRQALDYARIYRDSGPQGKNGSGDNLKNPEVFSCMVTQNAKMRATFRYLEATAHTSQPVMITGETGSGKELLAQAFHKASGRTGELVCVNVAGLDDHSFTDTLFGHTKGAFTGAMDKRAGMVEKAANGTLFLDEIGDLSLNSQIKLLRLLQENEYHPLGSDTPRQSSARIMAATNRSLEELNKSPNFRQDLYFRLLAHHVYLPPLRERRDDLPLLVEHFITEAAREFGVKKPRVPKGLLELLSAYHFPGNVRELRAMIFQGMSEVKGSNLPISPFMAHIKRHVSQPDGERFKGEVGSKPIVFGPELPTMDEAKDLLIDEALTRSKGNKSHAAAMLGMSRQAIMLRSRQKDG